MKFKKNKEKRNKSTNGLGYSEWQVARLRTLSRAHSRVQKLVLPNRMEQSPAQRTGRCVSTRICRVTASSMRQVLAWPPRDHQKTFPIRKPCYSKRQAEKYNKPIAS
ncbi:hypothetical protein VUR80DRAFT_4507 [Thermomyces stellatus]